MGGGLSKYIETGTAGQHQSGGPCCGDYCPLWEVGEGGGGGGDGEGEELLETDIDQQALMYMQSIRLLFACSSHLL